jgi:hypothetical protein
MSTKSVGEVESDYRQSKCQTVIILDQFCISLKHFRLRQKDLHPMSRVRKSCEFIQQQVYVLVLS